MPFRRTATASSISLTLASIRSRSSSGVRVSTTDFLFGFTALRRNLISRSDVLKQLCLPTEEAVSGPLDPVFNGGLVKLTNLFLGEILRRKNGPIAEAETLGSERANDLLSKLSAASSSSTHAT